MDGMVDDDRPASVGSSASSVRRPSWTGQGPSSWVSGVAHYLLDIRP